MSTRRNEIPITRAEDVEREEDRFVEGEESRSSREERRFSKAGSRFSRADGRSVPELIRELSHEGIELLRKEVALAKAELGEKIDTYRNSSISMALGGALLLAALLLFVQAVNHGLTALLAQVVDLEIAVWLAPLILALILAAIGWGMFTGGKNRMAEEGLMPEETARSLKEDRRWAGRKVREVKEEIKHG